MSRFFSHLRQNRASLFFFLTALTATLSCILRTLAFFISFDADIGYFQSASVLVIASTAFTILSVVLGAAVSFLINKERVPAEKTALPSPSFAAAALNASLLCITALFLLFRASSIPTPALLVLLTAFCLLGSAAYFLSRLLGAKSQTATALGFLPILAAALSLAVTYFDRYTQMNAPHKISLHLCALCIMFAMLYELRALLSRPMPRAYTAATTVAASLCAIFSLSNLIAFLGGAYHSLTYFFFDLAMLGYAAYFTAKCVRIALANVKKKEEVAK